MHEYYRINAEKINKKNCKMVKYIAPELEKLTGKEFDDIWKEIRTVYEEELMDKFPYIGGDDVSGTGNLTGAYAFVAMGEVLKKYGVSMEETGHLMVLSYSRMYEAYPGIVKFAMSKMFNSTKILTKMMVKKDASNAANAAKNPGSFETKTQIPPSEGYSFSYHNLVCPLSDFAKKHGYTEYMPYLCNLDYVMFGALNVPLYRTHTCFEDGDYCDFNLKAGSPCLNAWPVVSKQGQGYK